MAGCAGETLGAWRAGNRSRAGWSPPVGRVTTTISASAATQTASNAGTTMRRREGARAAAARRSAKSRDAAGRRAASAAVMLRVRCSLIDSSHALAQPGERALQVGLDGLHADVEHAGDLVDAEVVA